MTQKTSNGTVNNHGPPMPEDTIITCSGGLARLTLQVHYASSDSRLGGRVQAHRALVSLGVHCHPPCTIPPRKPYDATPKIITINLLAFGSHHITRHHLAKIIIITIDNQACNKCAAISSFYCYTVTLSILFELRLSSCAGVTRPCLHLVRQANVPITAGTCVL